MIVSQSTSYSRADRSLWQLSTHCGHWRHGSQSDVRALIVIWLPLAVGACQQQKPLDCTKLDLPSVDRCFEQNRAKGEAASLVACLPFSERLVTNGTWVVGFEKNDFFEWGTRAPPEDVLWTESTGASLVVDHDLPEKVAPVGPHTYAFQVDVVGRRALCPVGRMNGYPIAVEKLRINRRIAIR